MMKQTIRVCVAAACWLAGVAGGASLDSGEIGSLFTEANLAFRQANAASGKDQASQLYGEAIAAYERIIERGGVHSAGLYYNLANAYLLRGEIGPAILNYRRAEALDPANPDLQKNLAFARARRADQIPPAARQRVLGILFFWHYDFSMRTRFLVGALSFGLACVLLTAKVWRPRLRGPVPAAVLLLVITSAMAASLGVEHVRSRSVREGVILAGSVVARQGDSENYPQAFTEPLHEGVEFTLLQQRPGWWQIQLADGSRAWIPEDVAGLI